MLNFRNTNIIFISLLVALIAANNFYSIPFFIYALIIFFYLVVLFFGCYFIGSGFFIKIICSATTGKKEIAISFDDGPATSYTPGILKVLQEHNVKAAFFCIGKRINDNKAVFKRLHEEGHIIGNHSYSHHFWFDLFSSRKVLDDLEMMDTKTKEITGLQPKLFRPPYGVMNPNIKKAIIKGKYIPIGWSVRSMDTVISNEKKLFKKISRTLRPGDIFLFHDTSRTTLEVLPAFIKWVTGNGYEIVRLDKMLHLQAYA